MSDPTRRHLRLLSCPKRNVQEQLTLPFDDPFVVILAHLTNISEKSFLWLLSETRPHIAVDLRLVPRFNFGRLNRRVVFRLFEELSSSYYDLSHDLDISGRHDARFNPALFSSHLDSIVARTTPHAQRILIFMDDASVFDHSLEVLPKTMSAPPKGSWRVQGLAQDELEARTHMATIPVRSLNDG